MSQFNTLEDGSPSAPRRVPGGAETPRVPEIGTPSYRESFIPIHSVVDTSGSRMAAELQHDLGLFGHDVSALGEVQQRSDHEKAIQDEKNQRNVDKWNAEVERRTEAGDRLSASSAAIVNAPSLVHQIDNGTITIPNDENGHPMTIEQFAPMLVAQSRGEQSQTFKEHYDPHVTAHVIDALYKRADKVQLKADTELLHAHADQAIAAGDESGMRQAIADAKTTTGGRFTDDQYLAGVMIPALKDAARLASIDPDGAQKKFEAASNILGDSHLQEQGQFGVQMLTAANGYRIRQDRDFNNYAASMLTAGRNGADGEVVPFSTQRANLQKWADENKYVDQTSVKSALRAIKSAEESAFNDAKKAYAPVWEQQTKDQYAYQDALTLANGGQIGGGLGNIPHKTAVENPFGGKFDLSRSDRAEAATSAYFQGLDQQFPVNGPSATPETKVANFNARFDFMAKSGTTDPTLSATVMDANRLVAPGMAAKEIPPRFKEAYNQYEMGYNKNPAVMQSHFKGDTKTLGLFEVIHHLRTFGPPNLTVEEAASDAMRLADGKAGEAISKPITDDEVVKALPSLGYAKNNGEVKDIVKNYARAYAIIGGGGDPMQAAKERFTQEWTTQRGFLVNTKAHPIVKQAGFDMDGVSGAVIGHFLASHPDEGGPEMASRMVLSPERDGHWSIRYNSAFGTRVIDSPMLDDHDLSSIASIMQNQRDIAEYPGKVKSDQERLDAEQHSAFVTPIRRFLQGKRGLDIFPGNDAPPATLTPAPAPDEITPINPELNKLAAWIRDTEYALPKREHLAPEKPLTPEQERAIIRMESHGGRRPL